MLSQHVAEQTVIFAACPMKPGAGETVDKSIIAQSSLFDV